MSKAQKEINAVYETFNQAKKRERFDRPLQKIEAQYYNLLLGEMNLVKKQFNAFIKKG